MKSVLSFLSEIEIVGDSTAKNLGSTIGTTADYIGSSINYLANTSLGKAALMGGAAALLSRQIGKKIEQKEEETNTDNSPFPKTGSVSNKRSRATPLWLKKGGKKLS